MLALTRKPSEELTFQFKDSSGKEITITQRFNVIEGNQVRIGIDAPKEVSIVRSELLGR